jgi:hypothetical protein
MIKKKDVIVRYSVETGTTNDVYFEEIARCHGKLSMAWE